MGPFFFCFRLLLAVGVLWIAAQALLWVLRKLIRSPDPIFIDLGGAVARDWAIEDAEDRRASAWTLPVRDHRVTARKHTVQGTETEVRLEVELVPRPGPRTGTAYHHDGEVPLPELPMVIFHPEGRLDRWAKRLRIARELQLDDPAFDESVYVEGLADDETLARWLASSAVRDSITTLVRAGATVVLGGPDAPLVAKCPVKAGPTRWSTADFARFARHSSFTRSTRLPSRDCPTGPPGRVGLPPYWA
ncbi:MAG: hypothetical protein AAF715_25030 [Myxococcota bacterium]